SAKNAARRSTTHSDDCLRGPINSRVHGMDNKEEGRSPAINSRILAAWRYHPEMHESRCAIRAFSQKREAMRCGSEMCFSGGVLGVAPRLIADFQEIYRTSS